MASRSRLWPKFPTRGGDGGGDGPLSEAMRLARKLRGAQGAGEAAACEQAARTFNVEPVEVAKSLGMRGALATFEKRARLARYARARDGHDAA